MLQHRVVGGVPRDRERFGDPGHRQVLTHDGLQRPPQRTTRQARPRLGRLAGVLPPHMPAAGAPVAAHRHQQRRRPPPERLVRQPPEHGVARRTLAAAAAAALIRLEDAARQHRPIRLETLPEHDQTELAEAAERRQIRTGEGSVRHVEVFRLGGVGTPIIGRETACTSNRRPCTGDPARERGHRERGHGMRIDIGRDANPRPLLPGRRPRRADSVASDPCRQIRRRAEPRIWLGSERECFADDQQ